MTQKNFFRCYMAVSSRRPMQGEKISRVSREINEFTIQMGVASVGGILSPLSVLSDLRARSGRQGGMRPPSGAS